MKSEVLYSGDFKNSTKFLIKAIDTVESFDLKVSYCWLFALEIKTDDSLEVSL